MGHDLRDLLTAYRERAAMAEEIGAKAQADAIRWCAARLEECAQGREEECVSVEEAAARTNAAQETVRRAVRNGEIADLRTNPRGKMRIRVADLAVLRGKARGQRVEAGPSLDDPVARLTRRYFEEASARSG